MNTSPHSPALEAVLQKLRQAKEARQMSLSDIADATLISIQFLEQLDKGNTTFLPQTYVRAFMREYASVVGLDPDDIMREYDRATGNPPPSAQPPSAAPVETAEESPAIQPPVRHRAAEESSHKFGPLQIAVGAILVVILVVVAWNVLGRAPHPVQEVPFSSVVEENERQAAPAVHDSAATPPPAAARLDSLVLKARTTDTVWVRIAIDKLSPREYLIRPNRTMSWKARDQFLLIAVGNPTAVQFTLNNKTLGPMGRKGYALRNVALNRQTLQQR